MGGNVKDFLLLLEKENRRILLMLTRFKLEEKNGKILLLTEDKEAYTFVSREVSRMSCPFPVEVVLKAPGEPRKEGMAEGLNPRFRFENFVVGEGNRIAYEIALEVAKEPGKIYNPLFIYGDVGIGKTHLLQAIGNFCAGRGFKVIYRSASDFSEEMVEFLKRGEIKAFRDKYRNVDLLLIDDVQTLYGKERTQMEFFNIFNYLFMMDKQIVLASDRHPKDLKDVSKRLVSRFEGGVIIEVYLDEETKIEIIRRKLKELKLELKDSIVKLIHEKTSSNVREIEGFIKSLKVGGVKSFKVKKQERKEPLKRIQEKVASYFNLDPEDLIGNKKTSRINKARRIAMFLSRKLTDASLIEIARSFNRKDHSTVIYSIKKVEEEMRKDRKLAYIVAFLEKQISSVL